MNYNIPIALLSLLIIAGCGTSSVETKTVHFDRYSMEISTTYDQQETLENFNTKLASRQLLVFSSPINGSGFTNNILVTKVAVPDQVTTTETVTNLAMETLDTTFAGYEQISLKKSSFTCQEEKLNGYIHRYNVSQGLQGPGRLYYISQYYFLHNNSLYIVSGISDNQEEQTRFTNYFKTLACK